MKHIRKGKIGAFLFCYIGITGMCFAAEQSVWQGIYTEDQATRGQIIFDRACVACHARQPGQVAGHGPTPPLLGEDFKFRWVDSSIADLFDTIRQTMPEAAPNSLSAEEYASLTAFLLQINGYPAGINEIDPRSRVNLLDTYIDEYPPKQ